MLMNFFDIPKTSPRLIAVLRGIVPEQAKETGEILFEAGIRIMEVTLNSPRPYDSIQILRKALPDEVYLGAGTVLKTEEVVCVKNAGGTLVISPHMDEAIIQKTVTKKMISIPGVLTPTETIKAIQAGAHALKFFPAGVLGIGGLNSISAVIPSDFPVIAVGGINSQNMRSYYEAGYTWFGLGNNLFSVGDKPEDTQKKSKDLTEAYQKILGYFLGVKTSP